MMEDKLSLSKKQIEAINAFKNPDCNYVIMAGGMGSGKSIAGTIFVLSMAYNNPYTRYAVIRKNLNTIKKTTYQTFQSMAMQMNIPYKENKNEMRWSIQGPRGESQIWFVEMDETKDSDFNKVKGLELTGAMVDEVNELTELAVETLMGRVGRENSRGEKRFIYMTLNPANNWVKPAYYDKWKEGKLDLPYYYIHSTALDNPYLTADYLKNFESMRPAQRKRYLEGSWDVDENEFALFKNQDIENAKKSREAIGTSYIGIDVSTVGKDNTVVTRICDGHVVSQDKIVIDEKRKRDHDRVPLLIADVLETYMLEYKIGYDNCYIDSIGNGEAVFYEMQNRGYYLKEFKSQNRKALERDTHGMEKYDSLRSQTLWKLSNAIMKGQLTLNPDMDDYDFLMKDMAAVNYDMNERRISVDKKDVIKPRLGRSPDFLDALMMAFYGYEKDALSKPNYVPIPDIIY